MTADVKVQYVLWTETVSVCKGKHTDERNLDSESILHPVSEVFLEIFPHAEKLTLFWFDFQNYSESSSCT